MKYWVQELFALVIGAITWMAKRLVLRKNEYDVLKEGMLALLHDRLYQACSFFIEKGYCSLEDRENLEYLYEPYKALGGNGTGENLYRKCLELPFKQKDESQDETF